MPAPNATTASPVTASNPIPMNILAKMGMNGSHSSNMPTVEEPMPNSAIKIGMMISVLLPLKILSRNTTRPSKAPLLVMKLVDANVMKISMEISAAFSIPS